jgi:anti-sigma regulatory factor (Ser/Thr protein kinase)
MEITSSLVSVQEPTDVAEARRRAVDTASRLGFDEVVRGRVAIVVTEAATNILKHGAGGHVFIGLAGAGEPAGVQIIAMDRGKGIEHLAASLQDGFSTTGTSGTGLGAIRRTSSSFDLYSGAGGTVLAATIFPDEQRPVSLAGVSVAAPGERECGDGWAAWQAGALTSIFVCDGLGHGGGAAAAARAAIAAFLRHAERPARQVIEIVHDALRPTRGAAVAIAELDARGGTLRYCALGNISAVVTSANGDENRLMTLPGIAGHQMRRLQVVERPWTAGSMLVLYSDGVTSHWSLSQYPGLGTRRPDVVAGVLFRDHTRGRDDATVVAVAHDQAAR